MILLVTTSKSFMAVNSETGNKCVIDSGKGLYYGITFSDEAIFVAARNQSNCFNYLDERGDESGSILVFDYHLKLIDTIKAPFLLRDLHQIYLFDNKLWLTCSFDNMVAVYDFSKWERWYPSGKIEDLGKDINHFNSIWVDDESMYILAHNNGPSEIWQFSYPALCLQKKIQLGNCAHNIWKKNDEIYTCNSKFRTVESSSGFRLEVGGFTRGSVITKNCFAIGSSDIAERADRHLVSGSLFFYDSEWKIQSEINFENQGQILDIRSPGILDLCSPYAVGKIPYIDL